ncbi:rod shape-determining protein MreD [Paenibacillus sp. NEAU-GSW1]|nr:rod shape-determining protein MreD [Paenibacillus sp. NEAU-GSW1]
MSFNRLIVVMLLIFLIEGTIMPWIIPPDFAGRIVPHFTFVFVMYAALYSGRHYGLLLGIAFGFLQDIVFFGHLMGVHAFVMGLISYFTGLLLERRRSTLLTALSIIGLGSIVYDSTVYFIYKVFRITNETYAWALLDYILPSLFLQLAFALACYVPARRMNENLAKQGLQEKDEE